MKDGLMDMTTSLLCAILPPSTLLSNNMARREYIIYREGISSEQINKLSQPLGIRTGLSIEHEIEFFANENYEIHCFSSKELKNDVILIIDAEEIILTVTNPNRVYLECALVALLEDIGCKSDRPSPSWARIKWKDRKWWQFFIHP